MRQSIITLTGSLVVLLILLSVPAMADNDEFSIKGDEAAYWEGPHWQFGLRVAYRTDDTYHYDYQPTAGLRAFYWFKPWMAFAASGHYSSQNEFSSSTEYESLTLDFCWRTQQPDITIAPFFETGPSVSRYWVTRGGNDLSDSQLGLRLAMGVTLRISESQGLDLSFSKIFNEGNTEVYVLGAGVPAPCPPGEICDYPSYIPNAVYNESNFELTYRFGL